MKSLLILIIDLLIIGLFLYSKLAPHKARLGGLFLSIFSFFERLFEPLLNMLRKVFKPSPVGAGIAVDMSQIILLLIILLIQKLIL